MLTVTTAALAVFLGVGAEGGDLVKQRIDALFGQVGALALGELVAEKAVRPFRQLPPLVAGLDSASCVRL